MSSGMLRRDTGRRFIIIIIIIIIQHAWLLQRIYPSGNISRKILRDM